MGEPGMFDRFTCAQAQIRVNLHHLKDQILGFRRKIILSLVISQDSLHDKLTLIEDLVFNDFLVVRRKRQLARQSVQETNASTPYVYLLGVLRSWMQSFRSLERKRTLARAEHDKRVRFSLNLHIVALFLLFGLLVQLFAPLRIIHTLLGYLRIGV